MTREELIRLKKKKRLSVMRLSELSGVPVGTIAKIISGETKSPRPSTIEAVMTVLGNDEMPGDMSVDIPADKPENHSTEGSASFYTYDPAGTSESSMLCEAAASYGLLRKQQGQYRFADLMQLPEGPTAELIDGCLYDMAAPLYIHQKLAMEIYLTVRQYIDSHGGQCEAFVNAFGVFPDCDDKTYLIPDLSIVCDREKIHSSGIYGAPDFVLEILSPSTASKDRNHKFYKYLQCGVREYWMIDPEKMLIAAYRFFDDYYHYIGPLKGRLGLAIYGGEPEINLDSLARLIDSCREMRL